MSKQAMKADEAPPEEEAKPPRDNGRAGSGAGAFEGVPGPPPAILVGNLFDFVTKKQPWEVFGSYAERYGGVVAFSFGGREQLLVTDPELVLEVLENDFDHYYKKDPCEALLPVLSDTCEFVENGEKWERGRANDPVPVLLPPGVCPHAPDGTMPMAPPIDLDPAQASLGARVRARVAEGQEHPRDLRPDVVRLAFEALTLELFGTALGDEAYADYEKLTGWASKRLSPAPSLPESWKAARTRWRARVEGVVANASTYLEAAAPAAGSDVLRTVLRKGTKLDREHLALSLGSSVFGGTQSVASGVLSTLYLLAQRAGALARVEKDVRALPSSGRHAAFDAIDACESLEHALLEGLRLYPPAPIYMRNVQTSGPVTLGGRQIPADTTIYLTPWPLHRSREHWGDDADAFEPDRWKDGRRAKDPLGSGYFFPFGRGRRACAGQGLALVTMKIMLAEILTHARVEIAAGQPYETESYFGVLLPKTLKGRLVAPAADGASR